VIFGFWLFLVAARRGWFPEGGQVGRALAMGDLIVIVGID
jgi:hypothetical protein